MLYILYMLEAMLTDQDKFGLHKATSLSIAGLYMLAAISTIRPIIQGLVSLH